ncbi:DUF4167 domain-containing protein [Rhodospirillum rubrum]|uniref:DUF4167 domain-containing protein n=1 Tax=Rhodospirillum rubrum TaxID=1085 RepID=UPI0035E3FC4D
MNGKRPPNRNQVFDSNGPGVRVRGNAQQLVEKYLAMARDASSQGDRILAENCHQHADHYQRVLNALTGRYIRPEDPNQGGAYGEDEDFGDDDDFRGPRDYQPDYQQPDYRSDYREPRAEAREPREPRETREPREPREIREPREPRDNRDTREPREIREPREPREARETREPRDGREPREPREPREVRERRRRPAAEIAAEAEAEAEGQGGDASEQTIPA